MAELEIKRTLQSLLPGTRYSVRARAYNNYNVYSEWSEALEFLTPEDDGVPGPVTSVSNSFTSSDLLLFWDAPSLNTNGSECNDIAFYRLQITGYGNTVKTYKSLTESFQLTYATQKKDFTTPVPNPHVVITVVDTANNESVSVSSDPINFAPAQPSAPVVDSIPGALSVVMSSEGVEDFYYFILQVSQDDSTWSNLYSGADDNYHHAIAGGLTRYYRYKIVDRFGQESAFSASTSGTAISLATTHSHYLEDLINVNATPNTGDHLYWDGTYWSATPSSMDQYSLNTHSHYLNDLTDVNAAPNIGDILYWEGSYWAATPNGGGGDGGGGEYSDINHSHYLEDLINVNATPNHGDVLYWDDDGFWGATPNGGGGSQSSSSVVPTIDGVPSSPNADDHEFTSGLGSLTVVAGTAGTVTLTSASGNGAYEIVDNTLLAYPNNESNVLLRLDRTLADGESVVAKFMCPPSVSFMGFVLNDHDTDPHTATSSGRISLWLDPGNTRVITYDGGSQVAYKYLYTLNTSIYLRIARSSTTYYTFHSLDGTTWQYNASVTSATAPDNIWLYLRRTGSASMPSGEICGVDWMRFGDNNIHPWPYTSSAS